MALKNPKGLRSVILFLRECQPKSKAWRNSLRRSMKRLDNHQFWRELVQQDIQAEVDQREQEYMARLAEEDRLEEEYALPHVKEYLAYKNDHATEQQIAQYRRVTCQQAPRQAMVIVDELFAAHEPEQIVVDIVGLTLARKLAKSGSTYGCVKAA